MDGASFVGFSISLPDPANVAHARGKGLKNQSTFSRKPGYEYTSGVNSCRAARRQYVDL